jgi:hypothetical protein
MLAAMDDVAGKTPEPEREAPGKVEESADGCKSEAKQEQDAAEVTERIHGAFAYGVIVWGAIRQRNFMVRG